MAFRRYQDGGLVDQPAPRATWVGGPAPRATLVSQPPAAPSQTPAVTTGPATLPIGNTVDGALVTHYGYPGDKYWDSDSGKGYGDRDNILTPLRSVALTVDQRARLFPNAGTKNFPKTSTGQSFQLGGNTYVDDDTAPEPGYRVDIYHPNYAGLDQGVSAQTAAKRAAMMPPGYAPAIYNQPQPTGPAVAQMGGYSEQAPQHFQKGGPVTDPPPPALGAALQTAGQYAGTRDVLTPQNAPSYGLDPAKGYINPQFGVSQPTDTTPSPTVGGTALTGEARAKVLGEPPSQTAQGVESTKPSWTPPDTDKPTQPAKNGETKPIQPEAKPGWTPPDTDKPAEKPADDQSQSKPSWTPPDTDKPSPQAVQPQGEPEQKPPVPAPTPTPAGATSAEQPPAQQTATQPEKPTTPGGETIDWGKLGYKSFADYKAFVDQLGVHTATQGPGTTAILGPLDTSAPAPTTDQQPPSQPQEPAPKPESGVVGGNQIHGTSTIFHWNYDGSRDPDDPPGKSFFGIDLEPKGVKGVAVPVDVLESTFGKFTKLNPDGTYSALNTPEAKKAMAAIRSAHVEVPDAQGNTHKFPIVDIQGSLKGHPGKVLDLTYGAAQEMGFKDNHQVGYQIVGGDGKPYPISAEALAGGGAGGGGGGSRSEREKAWLDIGITPRIPTEGGGGGPPISQGPSPSGAGGGVGGGGGVPTRPEQSAGSVSLDLAAMAAGAAAGSAAAGGGGAGGAAPRALAAPPEETDPLAAKVQALINRGFTPAEAQARAQSLQTIIPHEPLEGGQPPSAPGIKPALPAPSLALPAPGGPPAAPGAGVEQAQVGLSDAIKVLQSLGFKQKGQAAAMLKGVTGKDAGELAKNALQAYQQGKGGAIPKPRPGQPPAAPGASQLPAPQTAQAPPSGPPTPAKAPVGSQPPAPGLPPAPQERRAQVAAQAESAIAEKRPMHISYISAPKEAERYPTRESRTIQYEEHSPEARLMGSTTGQLVGHSLIPVESKVDKKGDPYILGLSTNVMANNHRHINEKLATMGRQSPYPEFNQKFFHDVEGYLGNLNAGHTGTGQGYQVGTEEHPISPDLSHAPHKLTRHEADFINLAINNTKALAQHKRDPEKAAQAQALRELARSHGTLITEAGETNRMRHEIEQQQPGWATGIVNGRHVRGTQVLEPSVRSFTTGLIHEVHPSEASLPETIRPGPEYQQMTAALHRAIQRGRPDTAIATSLHSNLQHNANINAIERAFSEGKINEGHAREALRGLGEDPDEYRYIQGSGGLITPYEPDPEAIDQHEHDQLKTNLRKKWISGGMDIENYRKRSAEIPLPTKPTKSAEGEPEGSSSSPQPAEPYRATPRLAEPSRSPNEPRPITPRRAEPSQESTATAAAPTSEEEKPEEPAVPTPPMPTRPKPPRKAPVAPPEAPEAPAKVKTPEPPESAPETPVKEKPPKAPLPKPEEEEPTPAPVAKSAETPEEPEPTQPTQPKAEEPPPAPTGPTKKPAKAQAPKEKLSKPKDWKAASEAERQAYLEQKVAGTLADQYRGKETHELKVQRNEQGGIKYDPQGSPIYEKHDYDIANSPLLKKKALGEIEGADEHEDTLGDLIGPDGKVVIDPETGKPVKQHAHLNQVERRRLSAMRAKSAVATLGDKIVESYQKLQGMPEIMAGKGWYSRMRDRLAKHLGEHHEIFAQLLGATSAKTPVRSNFIQALDALEQLKEGKFDRHIQKYQEAYEKLKEGKGALSRYMIEQGIKPIDGSDSHSSDADAMAHWIEHHQILPRQRNGSKYNANSEAVLKVLAGTWLKEVGAPKTPNFAGNLTGRTLEATIDVWAARHLQRLGYEGLTKGKPWRAQAAAEPGVNGFDFAFSQDAMRHAADKLGIKPDDLQAVLWFAEKHHYEAKGWTRGQGAEKGSFDETADLAFPKSGKPMTSEEIKDHYNKVRLAHKALEYESHPKEFMRKKLGAYLEKHGIEQHHLEAARAEGAVPEEEG